MLSYLIYVLFLALDFIISIWNSYSSGINKAMLDKTPFSSIVSKILVYSGIGLAFFGMTYTLIVILSFIFYYFGVIGVGLLSYMLTFNFIVFGIMIISFGVIITIESVINAVKRRNLGSIFIAIYNVVVTIFDISIYASSFNSSIKLLRKNSRDSRSANFYEIIIIAFIISYMIVHTAYKKGYKSVSQIQSKNNLFGGNIGSQ